jgi:hypothetical protein
MENEKKLEEATIYESLNRQNVQESRGIKRKVAVGGLLLIALVHWSAHGVSYPGCGLSHVRRLCFINERAPA